MEKGELPDGWEMKTLGEVCEYDKKKNIDFLPYVGLEHIEGNTGRFIGSLEPLTVKSSTFYFTEEHLLYGRLRPYLNKVLLPDFKGHCSTEIFPIKVNIQVSKEFLFYWFMSSKTVEKIDATWTGARMPRANMKEVINFKIPLPPLSEQKQIVAILDKAFSAIDTAKANAEKNLKNAKELFESYLQEVFENKGEDWEEKRLSNLCKTGAGGTPLKSNKDYYINGTIPWLRSGEVNNRDIKKSELLITQKGLNNSSAKLFPQNTVLVAMYGATAGQVGILRFESTTNQAICGILPNDNIIPEFIYYKFKQGKDALVKQAVGGAQPNISQIKIKNTLIPNLSLREQKQIVEKLDELSAETKKLEAIYTQKIADLEEMKKGILQKAFRGELSVL